MVPLHPLVASRYGCSRSMFYLDLMHVMDCKGVAASVWGSILAALVSDPGMGRNQQVRLHHINMFMKAWYNDHPGVCKLPKLRMKTVSMRGGQICMGQPSKLP